MPILKILNFEAYEEDLLDRELDAILVQTFTAGPELRKSYSYVLQPVK